MNTFVSIDRLGHTQIPRKRTEHIGVFTAEPRFGGDQMDHVSKRVFGAAVSIFVNAHSDKVSGRFRLGVVQCHIVAG